EEFVPVDKYPEGRQGRNTTSQFASAYRHNHSRTTSIGKVQLLKHHNPQCCLPPHARFLSPPICAGRAPLFGMRLRTQPSDPLQQSQNPHLPRPCCSAQNFHV